MNIFYPCRVNTATQNNYFYDIIFNILIRKIKLQELMWVLWLLVSFSFLEGSSLEKCFDEQEIHRVQKMIEARQIRLHYLQKSLDDKKKRIKVIKLENMRFKSMSIIAPWLKLLVHDVRHKCILLKSELLSPKIQIEDDIKFLNKLLRNR